MSGLSVRALAPLVFVALGATPGCQAELQTGSPGSASSHWATDTDAAWAAMQTRLVGTWRATTSENRTIETSYRIVSKGSALVETFTSASGKETVSVYHRDGRALMLTHYCAQGNQARLKAIEASGGRVAFAFLDATNVTGSQAVMHRLSFVFGPDAFDQETMYLSPSGAEELTTLHFVRQ